jgi:hypothetical protein
MSVWFISSIGRILTVNKGILELWPPPHSTLIFLGILVCLPVAVLSKGRPEVEGVHAASRPPLEASRLVSWCRDAVEAVE